MVTTIPTIGFNVETVTYKNLKFQVWDLGGQTSIRPYWAWFYVSWILSNSGNNCKIMKSVVTTQTQMLLFMLSTRLIRSVLASQKVNSSLCWTKKNSEKVLLFECSKNDHFQPFYSFLQTNKTWKVQWVRLKSPKNWASLRYGKWISHFVWKLLIESENGKSSKRRR